MPGYPSNLYILPFDHRSSFIRAFLGNFKKLDKKQIKLIKDYKQIIFEGFLLSLEYLKNPADCAIMVDEEFGSALIKTAQKKDITVCLPVEKSGQKTFAFEYGKKFDKHILEVEPEIVKALIRCNPASLADRPASEKNNHSQLKKIKQLSDWCQLNDYKLMLELLVPPTPANLKRARNKKEIYDAKIRPALTIKTIQEFYNVGIQPDIWKIEAFESIDDWQEIIDLIRDEDRQDTAIIMLGRGESFAKVKHWMNIAPKHLLNGFAVGRTIFMRPLIDLYHKKINKKQTIQQIAKNYLELVRYWEKN